MATSTSISDWAKGIGLSLAASIIGGASKLAIRKSWLMEEAVVDTTKQSCEGLFRDVTVKPCLSSSLSLRLCGMFGMSILNPLCCVLAMQYASPSILAPFSGLTLVWIVVFSPMVLSEQLTRFQTISAGCIIVGEIMVAIWGDHTNNDSREETSTTIQNVVSSYQRPAFVAFFIGFAAWYALVFWWMNFAESPILKRFAWGVSGGSITGFQNFLKDALIVAKVVTSQTTGLDNSLILLLATLSFGAAATAFAGLLLLSACMKRYDATYSAAMFVGSFVVSASIMSAIHYDTFQHLSSIADVVLYLAGLFLIIVGVLVLIVDNDYYCSSFTRYSRPVDCGMH